jgi:hypothetical protein
MGDDLHTNNARKGLSKEYTWRLKGYRERGYTMVISNKITTWDGPTTKYQLMFYCPHDVGWTKVLELTIHGPNHFINYVGVTLLHLPNRGGQTYGCRNIPPLLIAQVATLSMAQWQVTWSVSYSQQLIGQRGLVGAVTLVAPQVLGTTPYGDEFKHA